MSKYKSEFLSILDERGFIHQMSDAEGLDDIASRNEVIAYVGYDCTAPSLHIGNFLSMMMLYWAALIFNLLDCFLRSRDMSKPKEVKYTASIAGPVIDYYEYRLWGN